MEFIKSCLVDFVLFSGIEGIIFCLFFEKIGGFKKFKWWQWLILSIGNCLISKLLPPLFYQIIMCIWSTIIIKIFNKNKSIKNCIKISIYSYLMFFIVEVIYGIFLEKIFYFNGLKSYLSLIEKSNLFLLMIPLRFFEIFIILIYSVVEVNIE